MTLSLTPFGISCLINGIAAAALGLFILFAPTPSKSLAHLWSIASFFISLWSIGLGLMVSEHDHARVVLWMHLHYFGCIFIPPSFFHFISALTLRHHWHRKTVLVAYLISIALFILNLKGLLVAGVQPKAEFLHYTVYGTFYPLFVIHLIGFAGYAHYLLIRALMKAHGGRKDQIRFMLFASIVGFVGGLSTLFPVFNIPAFYQLNYLMGLYVSIMSYAVFRHHLMDIEVIIKKTLVFTGLFGMGMAVVAGVTTVMQDYVGRYLAMNPMVSTILSVAAAILLYDPTRKFLVNVTDRYLFQKKEDFKKILNRLSQNIITILDLEKVGKTILSTLEQSLRLESGAILVKDENGEAYPALDTFGFRAADLAFPKESPLIRFLKERGEILNLEHEERKKDLPPAVLEPLQRMDTRICLPLFVHHELIGALTLGKKKSDEEFKQDEIEYFPTLSGQVAIALSNARLYDLLKKSEIDFAQQAKMAAIGTLSAGIGHEIKNPLAAIKTGVEMLRFNKKLGVYKDLDKEEYESIVGDVIERILHNVDRAVGVIDRLSSFAKKPKEIKIEAVNLEECMDGALSLLKKEFEHNNIWVKKEFPPNLPPVLADKVQMEDIFLNLLVNARHAIKEKGRITIKGSSRDGEVEIAVQDTGGGIPKENLDKIFDPFFTTKDVSRNPDSGAIKGTGLGLFLVREFIKKFGGRITVESELGKGTAFHIFLKAA